MKPQANAHIPWLDGLRGIAALWVLLSHVQILSGLRSVPVLSWGGLAVDLFMMLSGFLMAHHYLHRQQSEPWNKASTATSFWLRRYFRIAPLYYVLLVAALIFGPFIGESRDAIAAVWPITATETARFSDQSTINVLIHTSFLFGAVPHYSFRSALPDWSIGLEMQFYLAFPLIMLLFWRVGAIRAGAGLIAVSLALQWMFPGFMAAFPMPSFLPLKLYVFMAGMWLAVGRHDNMMGRHLLSAVAAFAVCSEPAHPVLRLAGILMVVCMFYLMDTGSLPLSQQLQKVIGALRIGFSGRVARFMGDTSYAVYLLHLLILTPIAGLLATMPVYVALNPWARYLICLFAVVATVYPLAWILHKTVELPGIKLAKLAIKALTGRSTGNRGLPSAR
ncbi:MAG: acyltransferase [Burkholderiales bacterium]|nr:acyltransferase [Burkholderiales bacterium]